MKNILVTGSSDSLYSHLIEGLLKDENNSIIGIDNFYSGTKENLDFIKPIEVDIRNFEEINQIIKDKQIEQIYHLAAIVSVQESTLNPLLSNKVNVKSTLNISEAARLNGVKKVVFSSSASVYGKEPIQPKNESSQTKPILPYGYEKLIAKQYMILYSELYGIETVSLRYFNVNGERQIAMSNYIGVISIFEKKIKDNETPNIYGDGEQYIDFVYVKDVVIRNRKAMNTLNISGEIFCVGTSMKVSINVLLSILNNKYSKNLKVNYLKVRDGDIKESISDNKKIKKYLEINEFIQFNKGTIKI